VARSFEIISSLFERVISTSMPVSFLNCGDQVGGYVIRPGDDLQDFGIVGVGLHPRQEPQQRGGAA
jgi:hypothetical protein